MPQGCKWVYIVASNFVPKGSYYWKKYAIKAYKSWESNGATGLKMFRMPASSLKVGVCWDMPTANATGLLEEVEVK